VGFVSGVPFDGGRAEEFGLHESFPGREGIGAPIYHVITMEDGSAVTLRGDRHLATFPARSDESSLDVYTGTWTVAGGTGAFANLQGGGTIVVRPESPTEIIQVFTGTLR